MYLPNIYEIKTWKKKRKLNIKDFFSEYVPTTNKLDMVGSDMIQTSKIGYEFYALLERWRIYNDEIMKDDITKTETAKQNVEK